MASTHPEHSAPDRPPVHLLVESQDRREPKEASHFLRAARRLAVAGTPTVVFLIDDGVAAAVGDQPELVGVLAAGGEVWADDVSVAQRAIPVGGLAPGVVATGLDKVVPLLCDPATQVVWH